MTVDDATPARPHEDPERGPGPTGTAESGPRDRATPRTTRSTTRPSRRDDPLAHPPGAADPRRGPPLHPVPGRPHAPGVSMELASRFWRAMGFADIGQAKALTEADVLALRRLAGLVEAGLLSEPMAVQVARSTGQTTARLAEWQIDSFLEGLTEPPEPGMTRTEVTYPLVELLLPELEEFLVYVWRRQLAAATGRVVQAADDEEMVDRRLAVGFADLVGFTRLTRRLEEEELGELVEAFETTCGRPGRRARRPADQDPRRRGAVRGRRRGHGGGDRAAADRDDDARRDDARAARRHRLRHGHDPDGRRLRHDGEPGEPPDVDSAEGRGAGRRRVRARSWSGPGTRRSRRRRRRRRPPRRRRRARSPPRTASRSSRCGSARCAGWAWSSPGC